MGRAGEVVHTNNKYLAVLKGALHTHASKVAAFLGSVALTIQARHEDDVTLETIEKALAKGRATGYGHDKLSGEI